MLYGIIAVVDQMPNSTDDVLVALDIVPLARAPDRPLSTR
jgi:hypothetical protein